MFWQTLTLIYKFWYNIKLIILFNTSGHTNIFLTELLPLFMLTLIVIIVSMMILKETRLIGNYFFRDENDKIGLHTTLYKKMITHIVNLNNNVSVLFITYRLIRLNLLNNLFIIYEIWGQLSIWIIYIHILLFLLFFCFRFQNMENFNHRKLECCCPFSRLRIGSM